MPAIDFVIQYEPSRTKRCRQVESVFDVPAQEKVSLEWKGELPIDDIDWNIGLIVGPSGIGKSTIGKQVFGKAYTRKLKWNAKNSLIDDFDKNLSVEQIASTLNSVGFNTIPAWFRPYNVLSTGEKFRSEIARALLEFDDPIVIDEFTSVVDRQVAKIGSYAVQKYVKRNNRKFVGISCHNDIIEWLEPDWIFEVSTMTFKPRGQLRQIKRPKIEIEIKRVSYDAWRLFAPYHYLTASLNKAARCFGLFINGNIAAFNGVLFRPHQKTRNLYGLSRAVTLPDYQGLGLIFILMENMGAIYNALGKRFRTYPAHPPFVRHFDKNPKWKLTKKPQLQQKYKGWKDVNKQNWGAYKSVSRPCATFEYVGGPMKDKKLAEKVYNSAPFNVI